MLHNFCWHEVYELCAQAEVKKKNQAGTKYDEGEKIKELKQTAVYFYSIWFRSRGGKFFFCRSLYA